MKHVDIGVLVFCGFTALYLLHESSVYRLERANVLQSSAPSVPIVLYNDLDTEVIMANVGTEKALKIYRWSDNLGRLREAKTVNIQDFRGIRRSSNIIKMATTKKSHRPGTDYLILLTNHLDLLLLDMDLNVEWMTSVPSDSIDYTIYDYEIVLSGTEIPLTYRDYGTIIVGIRKQEKDETSNEHYGHGNKFSGSLNFEGKTAHGSETYNERQFSYYAFGADAGVMLWKHEAENHENMHSDRKEKYDETIMSQHIWKLHTFSTSEHIESFHWNRFHDSVIHTLPYSWYSPEDTRIFFSHIEKQKVLKKS
eukprot:TRINITY_DN8084_c0_g1_i1.p1 TRINITY_DN8084_c0_g1~~TRINITY_DN8084_c0_g1_i1.p1  ORF type:complete len:309 (+),score=49.86 TRINITY_DN8084_c0_g1_i1:3-929(+)